MFSGLVLSPGWLSYGSCAALFLYYILLAAGDGDARNRRQLCRAPLASIGVLADFLLNSVAMIISAHLMRVFGSADRSGADRTLDRAGAAPE